MQGSTIQNWVILLLHVIQLLASHIADLQVWRNHRAANLKLYNFSTLKGCFGVRTQLKMDLLKMEILLLSILRKSSGESPSSL